jgi:hypothetical protein
MVGLTLQQEYSLLGCNAVWPVQSHIAFSTLKMEAMFLRNVGWFLKYYTALYARR